VATVSRRPARKLSLTSGMLSFGRRDKDKERHKDKEKEASPPLVPPNGMMTLSVGGKI